MCPNIEDLPPPPENALTYPSAAVVGASSRHLLLVSMIPPIQGSGSGIVLLRHIERFIKAGWRVTIAAPVHVVISTRRDTDPWTWVPIPLRLWWWPPVRSFNLASIRLRAALNAQALDNALSGDRPTHVLTLMWNSWPLTAVAYAVRRKIPLVTIIHDQEEAWAQSPAESRRLEERSRLVISGSDRVLAVSQNLLDAYGVSEEKGLVLLPIPGQNSYFLEQPPPRQDVPVLYFGGSLHPWQVDNLMPLAEVLASRGGRLVLMTSSHNVVWKAVSARFPQTERVEPPNDNEEAIRQVARYATAFLVSYAMNRDAQPWGATSFPSKLLDFARAGVPIIVLAPKGTATHSWCKAQAWSTLAEDVRPETLGRVLDVIVDPASRRSATNQIEELARRDFSATLIHDELEHALIDAAVAQSS